MPFSDLVPTLQLAIGPVILISGVGLILLSMTNRFGRVIDRSRLLTRELRESGGADRERILLQLRILWKRAKIERASIALAGFSVLLTAMLIITLFVGALLRLALGPEIVVLFVAAMLSLILGLLLFIADINLSLTALRHEIPEEGRRRDR